jgi:ADP-heptose:LPS heptosyltransferase
MAINYYRFMKSFYDSIKESRSIFVFDLGFLGDAVHLIPALWCIRQAMPRTRITVMTSDHVKSVFELTPWVDRVLGYARWPKNPSISENLRRIQALRHERFDALINLKGSERSALIGGLLGIPFQLGRIPERPPNAIWKHCFTHRVWEPHSGRPIFEQKWRCMTKAAFPGLTPVFETTMPPQVAAKMDHELADVGPFVHVSPCTSAAMRELPFSQQIGLLEHLHKTYPQYAVILSCGMHPREIEKTQALAAALSFRPARVWLGTLSIPELAVLINRSRLHIGGDTGSLHLAMLTHTPTLTWFRHEPRHVKQWIPSGKEHKAIFGSLTPQGLEGIQTYDLLELLDQSLQC